MTRAEILVLGACVLFGFCLGWWVCNKFSDADKVEKLEARIDFLISRVASMDALATEYEERKEVRKETVVKYVEKPIYRECKPDAGWVRDFNRAVENSAAR